MGFTIEEIKSNELLNAETIKYIPRQCKCGAEVLISNSIKHVYCSNKSCKYKTAYSLCKMLKRFNINWTLDECTKLCESIGMQNVFQILMFDIMENIEFSINNKTLKKLIESIKIALIEPIKLWEIAEIADIPYVSVVAKQLFKQYNTFDEAYKDIELNQVILISGKLGISNNNALPIAIKVFEEIIKCKETLLLGESLIPNIEHTNNYNIAVKGEIDGFINRKEYIQYLNNESNSNKKFNLVETINEKLDILVCDYVSNCSKVRIAKKINEKYIQGRILDGEISLSEIDNYEDIEHSIYKKGEKIVICTSNELLERLSKLKV